MTEKKFGIDDLTQEKIEWEHVIAVDEDEEDNSWFDDSDWFDDSPDPFDYIPRQYVK